MMRWLKTLPDHSYTDERMEEIHSKGDEKSATQPETIPDIDNTEHSANDLSCPGRSSDTKQAGYSREEKQQSEILDEVNAGL